MKFGHAFRPTGLCDEGVTQVEMGKGVIGFEFDGPFELFDCFVNEVSVQQCAPQIIVSSRVSWSLVDRVLPECELRAVHTIASIGHWAEHRRRKPDKGWEYPMGTAPERK